MKDIKYIELIAQHLSGEISESDRKDLMEWVNSDAKNQALLNETTQLWEISEEYDSPFETNVNDAWEKVEQRIEGNNDSSAKIIRLSNFRRWLQIAAVLLIGAVGLFFFLQNQEPELLAFNTIDEQKKDFLLPDSSRVVMNQNSHLTYQNIDGKRKVILEGEAWFDVKHMDDIPFEIESGATKTVVLGTAFNVRAYPEEEVVEVSVERGKVAFFEKDDQSNTTLLPAGQEGIFHKTDKKIDNVPRVNENANAWRTLTLDFENVKMFKVVETLEKYFDVEIEIDTVIKDCRFKGEYRNSKLDDLLRTIEYMMDAPFVEKEGKIIFSGGVCHDR